MVLWFQSVWNEMEEVWDEGAGQLIGFCDSKIHRVCLSVGFRWWYIPASVTSGPQWAKSKVNVWSLSKLAGCRPLASRRAKLWRVNSEDFHVGDSVIDIAGWDGDTLLWYGVHLFLCFFVPQLPCLLFSSSTDSQHLLALRFAQPSPCFQCMCCEDVFLNTFIVVYSYRWPFIFGALEEALYIEQYIHNALGVPCLTSCNEQMPTSGTGMSDCCPFFQARCVSSWVFIPFALVPFLSADVFQFQFHTWPLTCC